MSRRAGGGRGFLATRILRQAGFDAANVGGGYKTYRLLHPKSNGVIR
jgi:rhodanese-related sulfurtransferase